MPSATLVRYNNEPVRVCDRCIRDQNHMMLERRRAEDVERARARQVAALEEEERQREAERTQREREVAEAQARREMRLRAIEESTWARVLISARSGPDIRGVWTTARVMRRRSRCTRRS
jgi:hypothetical protein